MRNREQVYLETHLLSEPLAAQLVAAAVPLACATEMATVLTVAHAGGPRNLLYWDSNWKFPTRRSVYRIHSALINACRDDIELAIKLFALWESPLYGGYPLAPPWALSRVWHDLSIPAISDQMREVLGAAVGRMRKDVAGASTREQVMSIVKGYGIAPLASVWLAETLRCLEQAQRIAWAITYSIDWKMFPHRIEAERARLLSMGRGVWNPLRFDRIDDLRTLLSPYLTSVPSPHPSQWEEMRGQVWIVPEGFYHPEVGHSPPEVLPERAARMRTFFDQIVPLGGRYTCVVMQVARKGETLVELKHGLSGMPERHEEFSAGEDNIAPAPSHGYREINGQSDMVEHMTATTCAMIARYWPRRIFGLLQESGTFQVNDVLSAEVVDYRFTVLPFPLVILRPLPRYDPFDIFVAMFQVGDTIPVIPCAFKQLPGDLHGSLLVREETSGLEVYIEPDQLSFTPLGSAIKKIPLGKRLQVVVDEIDEGKRAVSLSTLPLLETCLNESLIARASKDGLVEAYDVEACVSCTDGANLLLLLTGSWTSYGLLLAAHLSRSRMASLAKGELIGTYFLLRIAFPKCSSSSKVERLPTEVRQSLDLGIGERLRWGEQKLHFQGRMSSPERSAYLAVSRDPAYQQAIRSLFLCSNRFEVIDVASVTGGDEDGVEVDGRISATSGIPHPYQPGDRTTGRVIALQPYGAFVELEPGVNGLVHKSNMVEGYVDEVSAVVTPGETIEVLVLDVGEHGRISLSMKLPENDLLQYYQEGDFVDGTVTRVEEYGAFVQVRPGVSGLVHKSNMIWDAYVPHAGEQARVGDSITACILSIDRGKRHLSLSMKHTQEDPLVSYQAGQVVLGKVVTVNMQSAMMEVEPGVRGILDRDDMHRNVRDVRKALASGDEIEMLIMRVDLHRRLLYLDTKELHR